MEKLNIYLDRSFDNLGKARSYLLNVYVCHYGLINDDIATLLRLSKNDSSLYKAIFEGLEVSDDSVVARNVLDSCRQMIKEKTEIKDRVHRSLQSVSNNYDDFCNDKLRRFSNEIKFLRFNDEVTIDEIIDIEDRIKAYRRKESKRQNDHVSSVKNKNITNEVNRLLSHIASYKKSAAELIRVNKAIEDEEIKNKDLKWDMQYPSPVHTKNSIWTVKKR